MEFKERLLALKVAWDNCPEIKYELENMKKIRISKKSFGKIFEGEEVEIVKNDSHLVTAYPYKAFANLYGIEVFCYLKEEDIDHPEVI